MKKSLSIIQKLLLPVLLLVAVPAATAANRFYAEAAHVLPGENATLVLCLDNEQPFYGLQTDITLPEGLEAVTTAEGKADVSLTARADASYTIVSNLLTPRSMRIGAFSTTHTALRGHAGALLMLKVRASEGFAGGNITVSNVLFTAANDRDVSLPNSSAEISNRPYVSTVSLNKTQLVLAEGAAATLVATVLPENAGNKVLSWTSSDASVATVDAGGRVTAVSQGKAVVTATSTDGSNISATCEVTVVRLVSGITLSESNVTLSAGQSRRLMATVLPASADNKALTWTSSNTSVATVDADGTVTAVSQGRAVITATATDGSGVSAACEITVVRLVSAITLSESSVTLTEGQTHRLTATILPEDAGNKTLTWISSNPLVAIVDAAGNVTAKSLGRAVVIALSTDGSNVSATCEVSVVKLVAGLILNENNVTLVEGFSHKLMATVLPEDATNTTLRWYSLDETVATVENDGTVRGVGPGETTIIVETCDGSDLRAECYVVIEDADGIVSLTGGMSLLVEQDCIVVEGLPDGEAVNVFSLDGVNRFHARSLGRRIAFRPDGRGVYIVVIGTQAYKIVVR